MNKKEYDLLLKIIISGDSGIGKTALLDRYTNNEFLDEDRYLSTIGIDFKIHYEKISNPLLTPIEVQSLLPNFLL